ncbi:unnamed protein product [Protopolystoma xenopodis]|uniref:Uncharacterized protein n=1 Tax=Protopolystoma xenopodis TaxID=117903 RepID=A0A448XFC9_9PLAT|nr:unnamed protein product [Protopolystoma xenopodis]
MVLVQNFFIHHKFPLHFHVHGSVNHYDADWLNLGELKNHAQPIGCTGVSVSNISGSAADQLSSPRVSIPSSCRLGDSEDIETLNKLSSIGMLAAKSSNQQNCITHLDKFTKSSKPLLSSMLNFTAGQTDGANQAPLGQRRSNLAKNNLVHSYDIHKQQKHDQRFHFPQGQEGSVEIPSSFVHRMHKFDRSHLQPPIVPLLARKALGIRDEPTYLSAEEQLYNLSEPELLGLSETEVRWRLLKCYDEPSNFDAVSESPLAWFVYIRGILGFFYYACRLIFYTT